MQLTPTSRIGKAVQYDEEGQDNPMRLNFNGTMPELPAPTPRAEKIVQRERAKAVITTPEPKTELRGAPIVTPEPEEKEEPEAPSEAEDAPDSKAESHDASASPAPADQFEARVALMEWREKATELKKKEEFDALCKKLLSGERVKKIDELALPRQRTIVSAIAAKVQSWMK